MRFATGRSYKGPWKDDYFHGSGLLTEEDGGVYKGNFSYGVKDGRFTR
jgi:hypothetical protein